ncbi:hypothetical protein GGI35DRAFT_454701 [Trichoderma velutinum]
MSSSMALLLMESWSWLQSTVWNQRLEQYRHASTWRPSWRCARRRGSTLRLPAVQVPSAPAWTKHTRPLACAHYGERLLLWAATQSRGWWSGCGATGLYRGCQVPVTWLLVTAASEHPVTETCVLQQQADVLVKIGAWQANLVRKQGGLAGMGLDLTSSATHGRAGQRSDRRPWLLYGG